MAGLHAVPGPLAAFKRWLCQPWSYDPDCPKRLETEMCTTQLVPPACGGLIQGSLFGKLREGGGLRGFRGHGLSGGQSAKLDFFLACGVVWTRGNKKRRPLAPPTPFKWTRAL